MGVTLNTIIALNPEVVTTVDGFTYERSAIEKWLVDHDTSPKTGAQLPLKLLIPNHMARSLILEFHEAQRAREG